MHRTFLVILYIRRRIEEIFNKVHWVVASKTSIRVINFSRRGINLACHKKEH